MTGGGVSLHLQESALAGAARELYGLLTQVAQTDVEADIDLAASARDRLVLLILEHDGSAIRTLVASAEGVFYRNCVSDRRLLETLMNLPPTSARALSGWEALDPLDERRFYGGLIGRLPQDLPDLAHYLIQGRSDDLLIQYVAWHPKCFTSEQERSKYLDYATWICSFCADLLEREDGPGIRPLLENVVGCLKSGAIYSCDGYLVAFAEAKSRLIRAYIRRKHGLMPASSRRAMPIPGDRPTRVGLLWNDCDLRTENIVGVAMSRYLRAHGFEVFSIVLNTTYFGDREADTLADEIAELSDRVVDLSATRGLPEHDETVRALDLDLLIFMNNVTFGYNDYVALATLKLARAQAVNFCAVFTTGFPAMDFYFSGELSEGGKAPQDGYTEQLVRLPGTCLIFDSDRRSGQPTWTSVGLNRRPNASTWFASGANFYKIHPLLSQTWARVLEATPGSRLVLYPFNPNWDRSYPLSKFRRRFERQLLDLGVDPSRVTIAGPWKEAGVVTELLLGVDVYLDSFPHSGGLSSLDALKLGLPVVALHGVTQRENQTADLLALMGLAEYITSSLDEYVALASRLAHEPGAWARFRAAILDRLDRAEFFDTKRYADRFAATLKHVLMAASS